MLWSRSFECAENGVHHLGVECMRGEQAAARDGLLCETLFQCRDFRRWPGDHAEAWIVDSGQRKRAIEMKVAAARGTASIEPDGRS